MFNPDVPPFTSIDINKNNAAEEFSSASVQEIILEPEMNGACEKLEKTALNDSINITNPNSPLMEEIATERENNIIITITEAQKIGEGMSSYVAYKVNTKTTMPVFNKHEFSVLRRFSDFLGLHEKLTEKHLRSGRIIPPAPEKSIVGTTKLKMSSTPDNVSNGTGAPNVHSDFVERRRAALERFVNRVAQHPVLCVDPDFRDFLESESELPKATSTSTLSGAGMLRLFNKVGETVNKITYKMEESDPWFEERTSRIEALEACLRQVCAACEGLAGERREAGARARDAARALSALAAADPHPTLSRAFSHLADTHEKVEQQRIEQSNTDYYVLTEHIKDYLGLIGAIKDVFHERVKVFQNWQHAQMQLTKRRENKAKNELLNRPEKVEQAVNEIVEWEAKVERGQNEFDTISLIIKKEIDRWEETRLEEMKTTLIRYLEEHMKHQSQAIRFWDAFLPEACAIKCNLRNSTAPSYLHS